MDLRSLPRWLGWTWVIAGALTVVAALVGAVVGFVVIGDVTAAAKDSVTVTRRVVATVADTTAAVHGVFASAGASLRDVQGTMSDTSITLTRAAVVTRQLGTVVTEEVPASVESVRAALPGLIDTAGVVDTAMRGLSFLGVDYRAEVPLDESLAEIDGQLADIPLLLRAQQASLDGIAADLGELSSATLEVGDDLGTIRARVADASTVLDGYARLAEESDELLMRVDATVTGRALLLRGLLAAVALGVAVTQTAPIALGLMVLRPYDS